MTNKENTIRFFGVISLVLLVGCEAKVAGRNSNPAPSPNPITIENEVECIVPESDEILACDVNGKKKKYCNVIKNSALRNVKRDFTVNSFLRNSEGGEVDSSDHPSRSEEFEIAGGGGEVKQVSYFVKCDYNNTSGLHVIQKILDESATQKEKLLSSYGFTGFPESYSGVCSDDCKGDSPAPFCFITALDVEKKDYGSYMSGLKLISEEFSAQKTVNADDLLKKLKIANSPDCSLGDMVFKDGFFVSVGNECGFKTGFTSSLDLVGNWQEITSYKFKKVNSKHVIFDFFSGPEVWYENKDGSPEESLNDGAAGNVRSLEFSENAVYLGMPNVCMVGKINVAN